VKEVESHRSGGGIGAIQIFSFSVIDTLQVLCVCWCGQKLSKPETMDLSCRSQYSLKTIDLAT
jgi:hypothetical protein